MRVVLDRSNELVRWASSNIPGLMGRSFEEKATAIGVESDDGKLMGAIVFHQWQPDHGTMQVSAASVDPRWLRAREAIAIMFDYAFRGCKCHKLWSATPRSNQRALKFVLGLGFKPEAILYKHYGNEDVVISRKFIWEHYGDVSSRSAKAA